MELPVVAREILEQVVVHDVAAVGVAERARRALLQIGNLQRFGQPSLREELVGAGHGAEICRVGVERGLGCALPPVVKQEVDAVVHGAVGGAQEFLGEGAIDYGFFLLGQGGLLPCSCDDERHTTQLNERVQYIFLERVHETHSSTFGRALAAVPRGSYD